MATTRRQRERMRIRANMEMLLPERSKPQPPKPKAKPKPKVKAVTKPPVQEPEPQKEIPQPNEEALNQKDFVKVDDILANPVLTPNEVGTLLRVSPETVLKLAQDGDLPALRMQKETRVLRIDLLRFMRDLRDKEEGLRRYHEDDLRPPMTGQTLERSRE